MSRALLVALLAVGCGRELNPEFCAHNPDDNECRVKGLAMVDAPEGCVQLGCTDQKRPVCETSSGSCVECLPAEVAGTDTCTPPNICGPDRMCHACLVDYTCTDSKVCLANGQCANKDNVLYAAPAPAGKGDTCLIDVPCTFNTAVSKMDDTRNIVKLTTTLGTDYNEPGVELAHSGTIIGTGATFIPTGGAGISMAGLANVEILGLTIQGSDAQGIVCDSTKLQLRRAAIIGSKGLGLQTTKCDATIERSKFARNLGGAMFISDGMFEVRNNVVGPANGTTGLDTGNLHIDKAKGRLIFNTVVNNNGKSNKPAGINCTGSAMLYAGQNISTENGDNRAISNFSGDCQHDFSTTSSITSIHFVNPDSDFHLTATSPTSNPVVVDDPDADRDPVHACRLPGSGPMGSYIDDFDGYLRPFHSYCDRGAYEYHTTTQ